MAALASFQITGSITGLPDADIPFASPVVTSPAAVGTRTQPALSSGNNTITIPSGTKIVIIVPLSSNAVALTMKGASGDTGVALSKVSPFFWPLDGTPASFILNAGGALAAGQVTIWFI